MRRYNKTMPRTAKNVSEMLNKAISYIIAAYRTVSLCLIFGIAATQVCAPAEPMNVVGKDSL